MLSPDILYTTTVSNSNRPISLDPYQIQRKWFWAQGGQLFDCRCPASGQLLYYRIHT